MELLRTLFPADQFSLVAIVLLMPALGAFVNGVFGKRLGKDAVRLMALVAVGVSFLASVVAFAMLASAGEESSGFTFVAWHWLDVSTAFGRGRSPIEVSFLVDRLSAVMMLIVTGVGFLIHVYASAYMWNDDRPDGGFHRFFAYLNLFLFSMLVLVTGASLPILFVGWEGVGLCSYLLIGFWYSESQNASAGKKAFIANRIGDFGLLGAMALILFYTGRLDWAGIRDNVSNLLQKVQVWPIGDGIPGFPGQEVTVTAATVIALLLFLGCAGKSAQIPLYVWLPDAMAGPTPVSALIHAATMVTAGVYLVCRTSFVFLYSPVAMMVVAFVGALTALFAATIGLTQTDIKKVLAYSTVSQLGYMFIAVGVGAFATGIFHVMTHAFFKACLFLGAGSVIHAMHAHVHDTDASQDMRNMGGLRKWMPVTYVTFFASCLAIAGIPPFSGFFSKDEILFRAAISHIGAVTVDGAHRTEAPAWFGWLLYTMGLLGAVLTSFYMFRALFLTFFGEFRGWKVNPALSHAGEAAGHDHAAEDDHASAGHGHGAGHGDGAAEPHPHAYSPDFEAPAPAESPRAMTGVLAVLGVLAVVGGFFNAGLFGEKLAFLEHWLEPVFPEAHLVVHADHHAVSELLLAVIGALVGLGGAGLAYWVYELKAGEPAKRLTTAAPGLYRLVLDKWRIDELYENTVLAMVHAVADVSVMVDRYLVDGILARLTALVAAVFGTLLRALQTGVVHAYAAAIAVGIFAMSWFFVVAPQAAVRVDASGSTGHYTVTAAPGIGYRYRWTSTHSDRPDTPDFDGRNTLQVDVTPGETRRITLEVRNAFSQVTRKSVELSGPSAVPKPSADLGRGAAR